MTVTTAQVTTLLENVLFESSTAATANAPGWTGFANLSTSYSTVSGLSSYLSTQPEAQIAEQVVRYYQAALSRVPSPSEISFYVSYAEKGLTSSQLGLGASAISTATWGQIAAFFTNSAEFKTDFNLTSTTNAGLQASNESLVITGFYTNILGRAPTSAEIQTYETAITNGADAAGLLQFFSNSPEYVNKASAQIEANLASAGVVAVNTPSGTNPLASTAPIGPSGSATPTNYILTAGVDTFTGAAGGNNVFTAADTSGGQTTLNSLDNINGGTGSGNVLNWAHNGAITTPIGATITNIQTANVAGTSVTLSTTGWTGLTTLNVTDSLGSTITAASATDVNLLSAVTSESVTGGSVVTITGNANGGTFFTKGAATSVSITNTGSGTVTVSKDAGSATITAAGAVNINGAKTFAVTDATEVAYATRIADLATKKAAVAAASAAASAHTAAVAVATHLSTTAGDLGAQVAADGSFAALKAHTLAAENAGYITAAQMASVNAAYYGALTAAGGSVAAAEAAAASAVATLHSAAVSASQAANTALNLANAAKTAASTVVSSDSAGGVVNVTATSLNNTALSSATVTGDYSGAVNITDHSATDLVLTTVTLVDAGAASLTGNGITTINDTSGGKNVTITNATPGYTLTLNLDNVSSAASGATPIITDFDSQATTVVINNLDTTKIDLVAAGATSLKITGSGSFTDTTALGTSTAAIDASGATGKVSVLITATDATHAQSFTGGSGGSTVEVTTAVAETKAVDAGTGASNTLILDSATTVASSTAAAFFSHFTSLTDKATGSINVGTFANSAFTSITLNSAGAESVTGLNATQAAAITDQEVASHTVTLGVTGASSPGHLDTVNLTVGNSAGSAQTISLLSVVGVETVQLTLANALTISDLTNAADGAMTSMTIAGKGNFTLVPTSAYQLNTNTIIDAHALVGNTDIDVHTTTTNGLEIIGSTTGNNTLVGNALTDVFVGGNGNDSISNGVAAGAITQTVTDGNGNDTITLNDTHASTDSITVGNGYNSITDSSIGTVTVSVGTGSNTINVASATSATVTLGAHTAAAGGDIILTGVVAAAATAADVVIKGAPTAGDILTLADASAASYTALATGVQTAITTLGTSAGTFATALVDAIQGGVAAHGATSFVYGGNTFIIENSTAAAYTGATTGLSAGDSLIEVMGVHTISTTVTGHSLTLTT